MPLPTPNILDVTIRDGSFCINHQFSPKMVSEICKALSEAGQEYVEISHGLGIGAKMMGFPGKVDDEELLEAAKNAAPDLKLGVLALVNDYSLPLIPALVDYFELGRVGTNVEKVKSAEKIIQKFKKYNKTVSLQLIQCHSRPPEVAARAAKQGESLGADIIYVVDTMGSFTPIEVQEYISAIQAETKLKIGFHGHNHIGLAIPNTIAAWEAGASWLDASLLGVGRGPGNTVLEYLVQLLQQKGHQKGINLKKLAQGTADHVLPLFIFPPHTRLFDLYSSQEKISYWPDNYLDLASSFFHFPLEKLYKNLRKKMGDEIQVKEDHLKLVLKEEGFDLEKLTTALNPPKEK